MTSVDTNSNSMQIDCYSNTIFIIIFNYIEEDVKQFLDDNGIGDVKATVFFLLGAIQLKIIRSVDSEGNSIARRRKTKQNNQNAQQIFNLK